MAPNDPNNGVNPTAMLIDAMTALTRQLQRNLEFYEKEDDRVKAQPPPRTARAQQEAGVSQLDLFNADLKPKVGYATLADRLRQDQGQGALFSNVAGGSMTTGGEQFTPPPPREYGTSFGDQFQRFRDTYKDEGARRALGIWAGRIDPNAPDQSDVTPGQGDPGNGLPPNSPGGGQGGGSGSGGSPPPPSGSGAPGSGNGPRDTPFQNQGNQGMLTWALLGEHGGPAWIRNLALEQWGLSRSLDWAQNNVGNIQGAMPDDFNRFGVNANNLQSFSDIIGIAQQHPVATYAGYKGLSSLVGGIRGLSGGMQNWQDVGSQLGVGVTPDRYIMGFRNPIAPLLSGATSVGMGAAVNRQELMGRLPGGSGMGSGLSGEQATEAVNQVMSQGFGANETKWGRGDIGMISSQYMGPLMQQYPGLSAADLGQFLPMLRNSGTSLQQLTNSLSDLGQAAAATHETIGQAAGSLASFQQQMHGMGSAQGAMNVGQSFRNVYGMDPQVAGQMFQNPLVQGMAMSQYGILPSGISDMNPGAANGLLGQSLNMLMNATAGLNQNVYGMVNGHRTLIEAGRQRQIDQVAQMMGIQPQEVERMMSQQQGNAARNTLITSLTGPGGFEAMTRGGKGHETAAERDAAQQYWMQNIAPNWRNTGISQHEMHRLNNMGFQSRIRQLHKDLDSSQARTSWGTTQQGMNAQTVNVSFTGAAAKFFQQVGPTTAKQASNAGGVSINGIWNSITGDITGSNGNSLVNDLVNPLNQFGLAKNAITDVGHLVGGLF